MSGISYHEIMYHVVSKSICFSDIPTPFPNIVHPQPKLIPKPSPIFMATDGEHWIARWCLPKFDKARPRRSEKPTMKETHQRRGLEITVITQKFIVVYQPKECTIKVEITQKHQKYWHSLIPPIWLRKLFTQQNPKTPCLMRATGS